MSILTDEIANDPLGLGYAAHLPDEPGTVVDILNAKNYTKTGTVSRNTFSVWTVKHNVRQQIEDFAADSQNPLRGAALALKDLLMTAGNSLDLADPDVMTFVNAWPMPAEAKDELIALSQRPASRAEVLGLSNVTVYDLIKEGVV